ncbi:tail associated lysin [Curtobacterium phage Ayka]|nr:tail associated lysin [Curtobacterium phage Ayka]
MANVTRVEAVGDNLLVYLDDDSTVFAFNTGGHNWVAEQAEDEKPPVSGGGGSGGGFTVGPAPDSLAVRGTDGVAYTLNKVQLTHARDIMSAALKIQNAANKDVIRIALITAIVESVLYMYANTAVYPETANYPHDRDHSDADSVGLFQQRPSIGWGTPKQCMTTDYSVNAFLNGAPGISGLFDISGWKLMSPGKAAQTVQGSAFPARYDVQVPVANAIMAAMLKEDSGSGGGSGEWQWPFKYSQWVFQTGPYASLAQFGMRVNPVTGIRTQHQGLDFGVGGIAGKDIPAAHAGTVEISASVAAPYFGYGAAILIRHPDGTACLYAHRPAKYLNVGDKVEKGQSVGKVGMSGQSTGYHLHWETWEKGNVKVNPRDFMKARGVPES